MSALRFSRPIVVAALALLLAGGVAAAMLAAPGRAPAAIPTLPPKASVEAPAAHAMPFGPIRPARPLPDLALTRDDGARTSLKAEAASGFTLVTLFFAGCTTTCPVQGAIFRAAQETLAAKKLDARLLSVSVDALGDDPARLAGWLKAQGAQAGWRAAKLELDGVGPLVDALQGRGRGYDVHDARVYLIDPRGRLVYVTEDLPSPDAIAALIADAQAHAREQGAAAFD